MPNCKFDNGLDGWHTFTEDGAANFSVLPGGGECHAPQCPAAYIVTENYFVGGIYQQVPVVAGNTYYANINWLVFDSLVNDASVNSVLGGIGRRVGIDPFGGADPRSSNVIWGPHNWRSDCKTCEAEYAATTAQADTITVFVRIEDTWRLRAAEKGIALPPGKDQFWLDEVGLKLITGEAAPVAPVANPTESPPADTPVNEATPTNTPANTPTSTPTKTAPTETQPVSPLSTPTEPAKTIAAPPTLTPTTTRTPTLTPTPRPSPQPTSTRRPTPEPAMASVIPGGLLGVAGTTLCAGGLILVIMTISVAGLIWLYRLGWGKTDSSAAGNDDFDEDNDSVVEIVED